MLVLVVVVGLATLVVLAVLVGNLLARTDSGREPRSRGGRTRHDQPGDP